MSSPERDPKMDLEEAVVGRLRDEGLIRSRRTTPTVLWGWLAISLLVVGGLLAISITTMWPQSDEPAPQAPSKTYILALYAGADYLLPTGNDRRLVEHGQWAGAHQTGPAQVVRGGPVSDSIAQFGQPGKKDQRLVGLFTVRANSSADAVRLANTIPHIRHGGSVVVYPTPSP